MWQFLKATWCDMTHGGGRIERDHLGRINWRCAKCGRWSNSPVPLRDETEMIDRDIAQFAKDTTDD